MGDQLEEDEPLPGQQYVCLSFLSPEKIEGYQDKPQLRGLKVRGVFKTRQKAENHCRTLRERDPHFDIYVGEVGKWLPWDSSDHTDDQDYAEPELNNMMKAYHENQKKAKEEMKSRVQKDVADSSKKSKDDSQDEDKIVGRM